MKRIIVSLIAVLFALPLIAGGPKDGKVLKAKNKIPGSYIVVLEDRVADVAGTAGDLVKQHSGRTKQIYGKALKGFAAELSEKEAAAVAADPRAKYVEEDSVVSIDTTQTGATWGLDRIDQRDLPLDSSY